MTAQFRLEVRIPDPAAAGFRLDVTPLGSPQPLSEAPGTFMLDVHKLAPSTDAGVLAPATVPLVWLDLYPWCTGIQTAQGHRPEAGLPATPGTLTATLKNAPDLGALGALPGSPIRLTADNGRVLWWGWTETDRDTWTPGAGEEVRKLTTLTAIDPHAILGNVTRYGARSPEPEPLTTRVDRLLQSSPIALQSDLYQRIVGWEGDETSIHPVYELAGHCEPTVMETSLLKHVTMAANSNGLAATIVGGWFAASDDYSGVVSFEDVTAPGSAYTDTAWYLTDDWDAPNPDPGHFGGLEAVSYLDISVATPDPLLSVLDVTNHLINPDDGRALDVSEAVTDPTAQAMFGRRAQGIDLTADPNAVEQVGQQLLAAHRDQPARPSAVTINGDDINLQISLPWLRIAVQRLGRTWWMSIVHVRHSIVPAPAADGHRRHRITLDLYPSP